jgi:hypothetical protein
MIEPALLLLIRLRLRGRIRALGRTLTTFKGLMLFLVAAVFFVPMLTSSLVMAPSATVAHLDAVRRYGPLFLLAYTAINLISALPDRAIFFDPAEVNFLFAGPFTRRQLLAYKVAAMLVPSVFLGLFLATAIGRQHARSLPAAWLSMTLFILFLQLAGMVTTLAACTLGEWAFNRRRRILSLLLVVLVVAAVLPLAPDLSTLSGETLRDRLIASPVVTALVTPFRWFIDLFTAERLWPDLVRSAALVLALNAVMLGLIFVLDARYLEVAAGISERIYARRQRVMATGGGAVALPSFGSKRVQLPSLPNWRGVGPLLWRQLTLALRSGSSVMVLIFFLIGGIGGGVFGRAQDTEANQLLLILGGITAYVTFFIGMTFVPFDFRGDIDRIDVLKALPVGSIACVVGQLLAPVLLLTIGQTLACFVGLAVAGKLTPTFPLFVALAFSVNLTMIANENLLFLVFPVRTANAPGDFQNVGRNLVLLLAKVVLAVVVFVLSGGTALLVGWLTNGSLVAVVTAAWVVLTGCGVGLLPLVRLAYDRFDVARDTPV